MAHGARRSGFTLVELMVVVLVMAVLAGAIAPNIVSVAERRGLDRAAVQVRDLLDFAEAAAIARRKTVAVHYDPERNACWVVLEETFLPWLGEEPAAEARVLAAVRLPEQVSVAILYGGAGEAPSRGDVRQGVIRFRPDATADEAVIELTDEDGRQETVRVRPSAGALIFAEEE